MEQARYWEKLDGDRIGCLLCPHGCKIAPDTVGICKVRRNLHGVLYTEVYGEFTSMHVDPIEKKPFYHFFPGAWILSVGTRGCNFRCSFCQNWEISQQQPTTHNILVHELVEMAGSRGSIGVAYTYNEPLIWHEFVFDCAKAARAQGLKNVLVTNGFVNPQPLKDLLPYIDAMNIDLKSFRDRFYRDLCGGRLQPVLDTIKTAAASTHVELTTLVIPGKNDSPGELEYIARWVAREVSPATPKHLLKARDIFREHLQYVYLGNLHTDDGGYTRCPGCGAVVIERTGYDVSLVDIEGTSCARCKAPVPVIFKQE